MKRSWIITGVLVVAFAVFGIYGVGFTMAIQEVLGKKESSFEAPKKEEVQQSTKETIITLGDSLTRGIGDEEALGYVGRFKKLYAQEKESPVYVNLSVSGAKSKDLLPLLDQQGAQHAIKQATIIVMTMGGNDLFPGWEGIQSIDVKSYQGNQKQFQQDATTILKKIRQLNKEATIYWFALYNPFEEIVDLKGTNSIVSAWNHLLENVAHQYEDVYVLPTYDLFQGQTKELLYSDRFHPNGKGYELMAERLYQKIRSQKEGGKGE